MSESPKSNPVVLYLARWYPNRYDPMPGLFIKRHAGAAGRFCRVGVVYTHVVEKEKISGFETVYHEINGVPTAEVYYNNPGVNLPLFTTLWKALRFFRANTKGMKRIRKETGDFDLIHVHVLTRLGLIALWHKWVHGKPYLISEHWSRYLPLTGDFRGPIRKWLTRLVVRKASAVTTVTQNLAGAMQNHGLKNSNYRVLANVVDDTFFNSKPEPDKPDGKKVILHVSCFEDKSKNVSGLLRVVKSLSEKRNDFVFRLIGNGMDFEAMCNYANQLGLDRTNIDFTGLLEGKALAGAMAAADLMVVFSNYENLPVVINEIFVLGIPVIATRVGGIPEYVNESNGRLIAAGDEHALEAILDDFLDGKLHFEQQAIRRKARQLFSTEKLGKELCDLYTAALDKQF